MSALRTTRSRPVRFTGVPAKRWRKAASSSASSSASGGESVLGSACSLVRRAASANLFHGHTARQSSQPNTRLPIGSRNSAGMWPLCSIVR